MEILQSSAFLSIGKQIAPLHRGRSPTTLTAVMSGDLSQMSLLCAAEFSLRGCDLLFGSFYDRQSDSHRTKSARMIKGEKSTHPPPWVPQLSAPQLLTTNTLLLPPLFLAQIIRTRNHSPSLRQFARNALYQSLCLNTPHSPRDLSLSFSISFKPFPYTNPAPSIYKNSSSP